MRHTVLKMRFFATVLLALVEHPHLASACVGDCDQNGTVSITELIRIVRMALSSLPTTTCAAVDLDQSGTVSIGEIVRAVDSAINSCSSPNVTPTHHQSAVATPTGTALKPLPSPTPSITPNCTITLDRTFISVPGCTSRPDSLRGILHLTTLPSSCCWTSHGSGLVQIEPGASCGTSDVHYELMPNDEANSLGTVVVFSAGTDESIATASFVQSRGCTKTATPRIVRTPTP